MEPAQTVVLAVDGNIACSTITTSGLEKPLTFNLPNNQQIEYDGGTARQVTIPPTPATPSTLTVTRGGNPYQTYDTTADRTIDIPVLPTLTLKHGSTTVGTYSTSDQTLVIPRPITATLTHSSAQTIAVPEQTYLLTYPTLLYSGYGLTLPAGTYLVEVSFYLENLSSTTDTLTIALTQSKTAVTSTYVKDQMYIAKEDSHTVNYRAVITLASQGDVGLAFQTEDDATDDGDNIKVRFGGTYPDVIMSATLVDNTSTTYSAPGGGH
eukprot:COSAG06_NODE_1804_length_8360_cov_8.543155_3_plen_266_part_00